VLAIGRDRDARDLAVLLDAGRADQPAVVADAEHRKSIASPT
jgi:hypothetical protein